MNSQPNRAVRREYKRRQWRYANQLWHETVYKKGKLHVAEEEKNYEVTRNEYRIGEPRRKRMEP